MADLSAKAFEVAELLRRDRAVLLEGPPAVGKTLLMNELRTWFGQVQDTEAVVDPGGPVLIPEAGGAAGDALSPGRSKRRVFELTMHPAIKFRDVWRGLTPKPGEANVLEVSRGTLYEANEWAKQSDGAALVLIDEFNRGPVNETIGPAMAAIEGDKRLAEDGTLHEGTGRFQLLDDTGQPEPYELSAHLYILVARNQADTSIETIDTAIIRRFAPAELNPSEDVLRQHFALDAVEGELPDTANSAHDVYRAAVRAWRRVNRNIVIGRGEHYRLGHGILMLGEGEPPEGSAELALTYIAPAWLAVERHVSEIFYRRDSQQAAVLMVDESGHPYELVEYSLGDAEVQRLERGDSAGAPETIWKVMRTIASAA